MRKTTLMKKQRSPKRLPPRKQQNLPTTMKMKRTLTRTVTVPVREKLRKTRKVPLPPKRPRPMKRQKNVRTPLRKLDVVRPLKRNCNSTTAL